MASSVTVHVQPCDYTCHAEPLCSMIQELAEYERMPEGPQLTPSKITEDLKLNNCFGYIASIESPDESKTEIFIGFCLCYNAYSTWEGKFIFLEDLYVKPEYRKLGVGTKLIKRVFQKAYDEKLPRVQWNVLNWNTSAIDYYKRLGAIDLHGTEGWIQFRMTTKEIEKVLNGST